MRADLLLSVFALTAFPADGLAPVDGLRPEQQQGSATLWVDKRRRQPLTLKLSETLTVVVRVDSEALTEVNETQKLRQNDGLWMQVISETRAGTQVKHWEKVYKVTPLQPGSHVLQLPALVYSEGDNGAEVKVAWEPLTLRITTRVAKVDISEARDITPIEELPPLPSDAEAQPVWPWLLAPLPLVVVVLVWVLRRRSSAAKEPPLYEVVLRHLQELQRQPTDSAAQVERWHTRLSDLLRWYLEKRLNLPATRQTTAEFFKALESNDKVAAQQRAQLNELLVQCDLAKFARVVPAREDCLHLVDAARKFVEAKLDNPTADVNGAPQLLEGKTESLKSASG
jgi:hypothetical protein